MARQSCLDRVLERLTSNSNFVIIFYAQAILVSRRRDDGGGSAGC